MKKLSTFASRFGRKGTKDWKDFENIDSMPRQAIYAEKKVNSLKGRKGK